jgi:predicted ATP-grasp superfamily ATP-dependent carboligase
VKPDIGAIVIGGDYQGLGIVRSLGRHGIPVFILDDEQSIGWLSRHTVGSLRVPTLRDDDATLEALRTLGQRPDLKGWVLFPTRDELVAVISRHKAALSEWFRVPTPHWDSIKWIWDKRNTYQLAADLKIPCPRTWVPKSLDDLKAIDAEFPLAIKPGIKEHFFYEVRAKAWRANSAEELRALFERASSVAGDGEIMVQDLIPGGGTSQVAYCAFFKNGRALGKMVARRLRQHPREFGRATTYAETVDIPELEELSERFLRAVDYYGLVEVEFKQDPRDGQFKLLDVNGRTWGYHTLGQAAGVDFPYLLYRDQMNQAVEPVRGRPGASWVRLTTDLPMGLSDVMQGRLKLSAYLRSVRNADHDAVFSWSDPLPGIFELALLPYLMLRRGF